MGARRTIPESRWSDGPARGRVAYDLLKLGQIVNYVHIAETFSQPKTAVTPSRKGLTPGLLLDMSRSR